MAAAPPALELDDGGDPLKLLLADGDEYDDSDAPSLSPASSPPTAGAVETHQTDNHLLRSVNATVSIRQIRSEGIAFQLWPAAATLVSLLDDSAVGPLSSVISALRSCGQLRILEVGSGTGLVGIAAAVALSATVTVTDLPHVLPNLHFNIDANSDVLAANNGTVSAAALRWGEDEDADLIGGDFDLVLASDVVYYDYLYDPLLKTLKLLFEGVEDDRKKRTAFVMAHLRRWKKESAFFKKARKMFDVEVIHTDKSSCPGSRTGVVVYCFKWRQKAANGVTADYR